MAHYKRRRPRTKGHDFSDYKHMVRRRGGEENVHRLYSSCTGAWNTLFHIRPHRRKETSCERRIIKGCDPDDILFPVYGKPHKYYW